MAVYGDTLNPGGQVLVLCQHLLQTLARLHVQTSLMQSLVTQLNLQASLDALNNKPADTMQVPFT